MRLGRGGWEEMVREVRWLEEGSSWCGRSGDRSGEGEHFWSSPEKFSGGGGGGRRRLGGGRPWLWWPDFMEGNNVTRQLFLCDDVTYPDEVEEIIGISIEVEPLDETPLEDLGLNTCNHDIPLSFREILNFDEPEPQPQPLPSCSSLEVDLGEERGPEPPIKPPSPDSFRMKEVDNLTNHTLPSPHVASFHPKDMYCYYHPCLGYLKKHYGFKPGLLGQSGSIGVCIYFRYGDEENDWELESKEVSFLGRGLNSPVRPKEVEEVRIKETHHLEHIIKQPLFQNITLSHHNGFYAVLSSDLTNKIACRKFLIKNEEEIFTDAGDGVRIYPDGVASPAM
ncbi:hypothetical protein Tco_0617170 [Tanacetum coccineum]